MGNAPRAAVRAGLACSPRPRTRNALGLPHRGNVGALALDNAGAPSMTAAELAQAMPDVARRFWGEPNPRHSSKKELRWGSNGARSVDVPKGTWFDHEVGEGGGVLDFLKRERVGDPWEWLREHGYGNASNGRANSQHKIVASYDYTDEFGTLLFQVVRLAPKTFRQRRPDGKGGWIWNLEGVTRVLYRLPDLMEALALERRVFLVEGEKDVETLARLGIVATCNPGGAGKWKDAYADQLAGADVVVLPDHDKAGRDHAEAVARSLAGTAARMRRLDLPGLPDKSDVSDWFSAGGTVEVFNALVEQAPDWTDTGTQDDRAAPQHNGRILRGTEFVDLSTTSKKVWLVHHLIAVGEISVWFGTPGSGKSVAIEDLGLHVAAGSRLWQNRQVKQGAVLYVALERFSVVARRAIAWAIEHDYSQSQLPFKVIRGPLDFREPQTAADIVATIEDLAHRHVCSAGLLIVDTVSRALCGGDENSPKDMGQLIANVSRIQSAIGVHIAMTHHQPVDGKERMRGHGALLGAVDTTVKVTNTNGIRLAEVEKSSDHEEGQRVAFTLKSITVDPDDGYGDPITAPVVIEDQAPPKQTAKRAVKVPKNATLALNALRDAVSDLGQRVANAHVPAGVSVVTLDQWRDYAYRRGLGGDEADSRQKAFTRAKECLAGSSLVGIWEPYAWPV